MRRCKLTSHVGKPYSFLCVCLFGFCFVCIFLQPASPLISAITTCHGLTDYTYSGLNFLRLTIGCNPVLCFGWTYGLVFHCYNKLSCVCVFVSLSVCNKSNTVFMYPCISKGSPNFTKPSAYVKFGLPSCLNCSGHCTCQCACTACENMHPILVPFFATDLVNSSECWCSKENEYCSGGYHELIYNVGGSKLGRRPVVWAKGLPLIFNLAEFGCSEENEGCLGGYSVLIYNVVVGGGVMIFFMCLRAWL